MSTASISPRPLNSSHTSQASSSDNPIDLTQDDYDEPLPKRQRTDLNFDTSMSPFFANRLNVGAYRPAFAPPAPPSAPASMSIPPPNIPAKPPSLSQGSQSSRRHGDNQVIDLTGSRSPSPHSTATRQLANLNMHSPLPQELSPKTPVCIGQLLVTALVLYPVPYLQSTMDAPDVIEWASVRLVYEHAPNRSEGTETIHIRIPRDHPSAGVDPDETFGVVEQKIATVLGPTLAQGHIRLEGKVRRGLPHLPILPLQLIVYTPKGNIPTIGNYFMAQGLLLDHPTPPFDTRFKTSYYHNPHNPPPGGHHRVVMPPNRLNYASRWNAPSVPGKSVEVQRSQVDQLFKSLKSGATLPETNPSPLIASKLYPHQKKALTFLLQRERELTDSEGKYPSLWEYRDDSDGKRWLHVVTDKEIQEEPQEAKGAILADDVRTGPALFYGI
jgi:SWI/SNF-related matrix-associated actin-dependent regulator of chromatin subfamily A3